REGYGYAINFTLFGSRECNQSPAGGRGAGCIGVYPVTELTPILKLIKTQTFKCMKFFIRTGHKLPAYAFNNLVIATSGLFLFSLEKKRRIIMRINFTFALLITVFLQISPAANA